MHWFDAHLDLAYLAACGRDMRSDPAQAGGPDLPAAVTLPSLAAGNVRACLATIFTEPDGSPSAIAYPSEDPEAAHAAGLRQLRIYQAWAQQRLITLRGPAVPAGLRGPAVPAGSSSTPPLRHSATPPLPPPLLCSLLIEGADPIRSPDELPFWVSHGVVAIGLAWAKPSRYAGGNSTNLGLTDLGRAMIRAIDSLAVVHDLSHLSDRATRELLDLTDRRVIASHSNCRALIARPAASRATGNGSALPVPTPNDPISPDVPPFQRHLTDSTIKEIARRDGVVGLNLFSPFIIPGGLRDRRASIAQWADHADHVVQLHGNHHHIGLGSDMDGGFSALRMPEGLNQPSDLHLLADALRARGWSDQALQALAFNNWARIFPVPRPSGA